MKKRILASILCVAASVCAPAQTTVFGGGAKLGGGAQTSRFTRNGTVTMVFPPGTSSADYAKVRAAGSVWDSPYVDMVTVQVNASNVDQINAVSTGGQQAYIPATSPTGLGHCNGYTVDTDQCIKMTGALVGNTLVAFAAPIYFPFDWATIESTTSPGIDQWFQATPGGVRKQVSLKDFSQSNGAINGSTPSFIGVGSYLSLFPNTTQDFLNAVQTVNSCTGQYTGHTGLAAARSGTATVTVTLNSHGYTTGQTVWVNATAGSGTFSQYSNTTTGVTITVTTANAFTYTAPGGSATDTATLTLVADSESYVVPYELPFLTFRQAFLKAVHNHFNASYSNAVGGTAAQLGYWDNGQSAGGEAYPFCYANMQALASPYTLAADTATTPGVGNSCFTSCAGGSTWGFVTYYKNDLTFGESLHSYMRLYNSLNNGGTGSQANFSWSLAESAAGALRTNGSGLFDGIGQQGGSVGDITALFNNSTQAFSILQPPNMCGNNGCAMITANSNSGMPLEIQVISISAYDDPACNPAKNGGTKCSVPSTGTGGDSGDMRQMLALYTGLPATDGTNTVTLAGHASVYEGYYRDLAEALDPNFATVAVGGNYTNVGGNYTWYTAAYQLTAFQAVGLGAGCASQYTTATPQVGSTGDCSYALALKNFHGQH